MIKHVVMWRLKEEAMKGNKKVNAEKMKQMLLDLKGVITELKDIEVGINFTKSEAAYDICLLTSFEDDEALNRYRVHPQHLEVVDFIGKVTYERVVVDYNL